MKSLVFSAMFALAASVAHAQSYTYAQFEVSVNHIDLETCPQQVTATGVFCRATVLHDNVHVYVFEEDGDMVFVDMLTFDEEGYIVAFQ